MRKTIGIVLILSACARPAPQEAPPDAAPAREEVVSLLDALENSFYGHWGAVEATPEYRRLRSAHVPVLRSIADANGAHALMALRILARLAPAEQFSPTARAILYASALEREQNFVRWGVIAPAGFLPGVYGDELLRVGAAAAPYLQKRLRDTRRAWVIGGEGEQTSRAQGDRVCDYAWVFLATIFDRPLAYHADPRLRDPQIHALDLWLDQRLR